MKRREKCRSLSLHIHTQKMHHPSPPPLTHSVVVVVGDWPSAGVAGKEKSTGEGGGAGVS